MNLGDKIHLFRESFTYFLGSDHEFCNKVYNFLQEHSYDFDLELCLFYKNKVLQKKYKFQIFTDSPELLAFLIHCTGISIPRHPYLRWVQFVLEDSGSEEYRLTQVAFAYVQRDIRYFLDFSKKFFFHTDGTISTENRLYEHKFSWCYQQNRTIGNWRWFNIVDVFFLKKDFFWEIKKTCYFLLRGGTYTYKDIESKFGVETPICLHDSCFAWAICIWKDSENKYNEKEFSAYFWTYY